MLRSNVYRVTLQTPADQNQNQQPFVTERRGGIGSEPLTAELPRDPDLPLQRVDLWVDGDAAVVAHPEGLHHPLLQRLRHVLLGHMEDPQVGKTAGSQKRVRFCWSDPHRVEPEPQLG